MLVVSLWLRVSSKYRLLDVCSLFHIVIVFFLVGVLYMLCKYNIDRGDSTFLLMMSVPVPANCSFVFKEADAASLQKL